MTPLEAAEAKIVGLEAAISFIRREQCSQQASLYRSIARGHDARAHNEDIKERYYECVNQHQPLADVVANVIDDVEHRSLTEKDTLREDIVNTIHYVVFGRKL